MSKVLVLVGTLLLLGVAAASFQTEDAAQEKFPVSKSSNIQSPAKTLNNYKLNSRIVTVYGVIDENNAGQVAKQLLRLEESPEPITVLINSPGGSVIDGASIVSALQARKGPVNTICVQICASMAAMLHQFGTKRLMLDRSVLMFHPASGGAQGEVDKMGSEIRLYQSLVGEMERNAAGRSGMSYSDYKAKSGIELWLTADEASAQHFSDGTVFIRGAASEYLFPERISILEQGKRGGLNWISDSALKMLQRN